MKKAVFVIVFTAFIYSLGLIPLVRIPFINTPILFQNAGILIAGMVLGASGTLSVILFLLLAIIGLPVLEGGRGGYIVFLSPTAGYLYGYIIATFIIGAFTKTFVDRLNYFRLLCIAFLGMCIIYLIGVPIYATISNTDIFSAIKGITPFIPGDIIKIILSTIIAMQFYKYYPLLYTKNRVYDSTI